MDKVLNMTYSSSLTDLCEINSSFDHGVLRIAYAGQNRNNSYISKEAFEKCIHTMYNCPIVCHYERETNSLGGHDMEVVRDSDGDIRLVNLTEPVGCIPESAKYWWDTVEEDDGTTHEYLFTEALLWKRQEAYKKIKQDGVTSHSMEITVFNGQSVDGIYYINDFEFTAFALIGVEPCFESSSIELFSAKDFKNEMAEMMQELKQTIIEVSTSETDDGHITNYSIEKGGEKVLEENKIEEVTEESQELAFSEEQDVEAPVTEEDQTEDKEAYALTSNIVEEICRSLEAVTIEREWGTYERYFFADCDMELQEVYCWDREDWLLYGFPYEMDGDNVNIRFDDKKRKKYVIADFDEGEQASPFATVFEMAEQKIRDNTDLEQRYQDASKTICDMQSEIEELRQFKNNVEESAVAAERERIFCKFEDLSGIDAFENLKENCNQYDLETLEEKCYAIRGKYKSSAEKFSVGQKNVKLPVTKTVSEKEPYGGVVEKYCR